ncbi:hypothetical protein Tco_0412942 [Tanacetum coccineum]
MIFDRWSKETRCYIFEALNGIHHWEDSRINVFKAEMSTKTKGSVYSNLRIKSVVRVVIKKKWGYGFLSSILVRRFDDKKYEFSYADLPRLSLNDVEDKYLLQVQDKIHHLPLEFLKDFNNALLLFIKRLIEVKKFYDGTLIKIRENLIDMVKKNKLGTDKKRLKGRDWIDMDVEKSKKTVDKIDKTLKRREQLRRLEEYVGGRSKTVNPHLPSRVQDYPDKDYQGRLLASFLHDAKYEHVGQDTRSLDGKDDKYKQGKELKITELKTKLKDNDKGSRSKITQHKRTSLQQR